MKWPVTVEIPFVPPSWNRVSRSHWSVRHRVVKLWAKALDIAVLATYKGAIYEQANAGTRMQVAITIRRKRLLDPDNAQYCAKPILDAMTRLHFIRDDSNQFIELLPVIQVKCFPRGPESTLVSFQPCAY